MGDWVAHWPRPIQDECIVKRSAKIAIGKTELEWPGGGARLGPQKHAASRALLRTQGVLKVMKLADVVKCGSQEKSSGAVFLGTSVPIKLLFEFLEDDQTITTFVEQFPMVSRDQARAVLGASLAMLLSAAGSEI